MTVQESDTLITVAAKTTASLGDLCGWVSGSPGSALTCNPGQRCGIDTENRLVGCCWTGENGDECTMSTRCVEGGTYVNLHSAAMKRELVCYGDRAPYCKTNVFAADGDLSGYSLFICDTDRARETVWRHLVSTGSVSSSSSLSTATTVESSSRAGHPTSSSLPMPSPSSLPSAHIPTSTFISISGASTFSTSTSLPGTSTLAPATSSAIPPRFGPLGNDVGSLVGTIVGGAAFVAAAGGVTLWLTLKLKNKLRLSVGREAQNNTQQEPWRAQLAQDRTETGTNDGTVDGTESTTARAGTDDGRGHGRRN
ncbi:hypothetical protein CDD81_3751 [Ophiocordyceps australis]|uniref:Uncharacterized protein n=1 Tax=Ophiocordyceps australis TaxID=1399860 RepID=A0A2C5YD54_9HYPO|nr:hypothetical protein CDD81_3751 [Ophiocordyceps australis]